MTTAIQGMTSSLDGALGSSTSWAEMTRSIDAARKTLPWKEGSFEPPKTISLRERKLRERDVDLLTQSFRDPVREDMAVTMKSTFDSKLLTRRDDLKKNKFNIINRRRIFKWRSCKSN